MCSRICLQVYLVQQFLVSPSVTFSVIVPSLGVQQMYNCFPLSQYSPLLKKQSCIGGLGLSFEEISQINFLGNKKLDPDLVAPSWPLEAMTTQGLLQRQQHQLWLINGEAPSQGNQARHNRSVYFLPHNDWTSTLPLTVEVKILCLFQISELLLFTSLYFCSIFFPSLQRYMFVRVSMCLHIFLYYIFAILGWRLEGKRSSFR